MMCFCLKGHKVLANLDKLCRTKEIHIYNIIMTYEVVCLLLKVWKLIVQLAVKVRNFAIQHVM